jgi:oleate hydratase
LTTEEALGTKTIDDYFPEEFFTSNFWYFWRSMFAFETWQSLVEMKRYFNRFMHMIDGLNVLKGILHSEYNQYDSFILPVVNWLKEQGVDMVLNTTVTDIQFKDDAKAGSDIVATGIDMEVDGQATHVDVNENDVVAFTNGSMTQNTTYGDLNTAAILDEKEDKGVFSLWEKIVEKSGNNPLFGNPKPFDSNIPATKWISWTVTLKDDDIVFPYLLELTGDKPGMGGLVTIKESNWYLNWVVPKQPHFRNQPDNVKVLWLYALLLDEPGNKTGKTAQESTGKEAWEEAIYHMGLEDKTDDIMSHTVNVIPALMPYITSQFQPRAIGDRPNVVPTGSKNFAFVGQFAEIPKDTIFTVEYSVRSGRIAAYELLGLEKEISEVFPSQYDIRVQTKAIRKVLGMDNFPLESFSVEQLKQQAQQTKLVDIPENLDLDALQKMPLVQVLAQSDLKDLF